MFIIPLKYTVQYSILFIYLSVSVSFLVFTWRTYILNIWLLIFTFTFVSHVDVLMDELTCWWRCRTPPQCLSGRRP